MSIIFVLFYISWFFICFLAMVTVKFYLGQCHFNYYFLDECIYIQEEFS